MMNTKDKLQSLLDNLEPEPHYFNFLTQSSCKFSDEKAKRHAQASEKHGTKWIDELEKDFESEYSRDYFSDEFPPYAMFPVTLHKMFAKIDVGIKESKNNYLSEHAERHEVGDDIVLYILDDKEEVYMSTPHYNYGEITRMKATKEWSDDVTASYIFINEHKTWADKHAANYKAANILSKFLC